MVLVENAQREGNKTPQKGDQQQIGTSWSKKMANHVYIHPSTMTLCGLTFMCPAIVDYQHVLIAVPDSRLLITNVTVSEWTATNVLNKKPGQFAVVYALNNVDLAAAEIHVRPM